MVGIQFIMTMSFSFLSPIMPLFLPELGVQSESAIDIWAGVLSGTTSFVAAFASPIWGRLSDQHGRKLMLIRSSFAIALFTALMGVAGNVWQFFAFRALMGLFVGSESGAESCARLINLLQRLCNLRVRHVEGFPFLIEILGSCHLGREEAFRPIELRLCEHLCCLRLLPRGSAGTDLSHLIIHVLNRVVEFVRLRFGLLQDVL